MLDTFDRFIKAVPGLVTSLLAILNFLAGTGLAHEKWEAGTQKAAGLLGVIISLAIAVLYDDANINKKKQLIRLSVFALIGTAIFTFGADVLQSEFARTKGEVYFLRDVLWRFVYFLLCISIVLCIGCISLLIPKFSAGNSG